MAAAKKVRVYDPAKDLKPGRWARYRGISPRSAMASLQNSVSVEIAEKVRLK
jgi:hypothetical protein